MLLDVVTKDATDRSVILRIIDSADGTPETGVVYNTSGIDLWYRREGAAKTSITEASLSALTDAHSDGGFLHIGDGYYRLDLPDAAVATGANYVDVGGSVTGMVVIGGRVRLTNFDLETAVQDVNVTKFGGSNGTFASGRPEVKVNSIATDAVDAAALKADAVAEIQSGLSTYAGADTSGTTTLLSRLSATRAGYLDNLSAGAVALASTFTGITSLAQWLGLLAGKQSGNAAARTEIRATGAGSGTFDETTDSLEAVRDRGDAAWTTVTAAAIRSAVGLASANLDTQLAALDSTLDDVAAILALVNFSSRDEVLVDVRAINDAPLDGAGVLGDEWRPA